MSESRSLARKWEQSLLQHRWLRALLSWNEALLARLDRALSRNPAWYLAAAALLGLQAALILTHEPWLDEYQAVQIAVQAPDLETLFAWLRYEGHPPLYYLILRGLAHWMDPLATLPVAALIFAALVQPAILFASPFTRAERLLIAAGEFVLFEFLTLSRSMNLGVAMLVLAFASRRRRISWLAIAVLPFCDFLFGVLSGVLLLLKWREKALWWPGVALWLVSGLAAAWSVRPAPDMIPALELLGFGKDLLNWMSSVGTLALPFQGGLLSQWNVPVWPIGGFLWLPFLWLAWRESGKVPFHRLMLFGFVGFTLLFSLAVYPLAIRHLMLIALLFVLLAWRQREQGIASGRGFRLWLSVAAACGFATAAINFVMPFDTAGKAAAEIERRGLQDGHWMVFPDSRAQGVSALTGMLFERTERHCMQDFIRWDYRTGLTTPELFERYLRDEVARHGRFYLLSEFRLGTLPPDLVKPLAAIPAGYDGQEFHLFEVGPGAQEKPVNLPPCVKGRRPFERF